MNDKWLVRDRTYVIWTSENVAGTIVWYAFELTVKEYPDDGCGNRNGKSYIGHATLYTYVGGGNPDTVLEEGNSKSVVVEDIPDEVIGEFRDRVMKDVDADLGHATDKEMFPNE